HRRLRGQDHCERHGRKRQSREDAFHHKPSSSSSRSRVLTGRPLRNVESEPEMRLTSGASEALRNSTRGTGYWDRCKAHAIATVARVSAAKSAVQGAPRLENLVCIMDGCPLRTPRQHLFSPAKRIWPTGSRSLSSLCIRRRSFRSGAGIASD